MSARCCNILLMLCILALATLLRVWALDRPALWWDEGNNAYFAHQTPAGVLALTQETHDTDPPAHRLALGLWLGIFGDSAWSLRFLSVVLGVAVVLVVYWWGSWLGGTGVGLLAATLTALLPMGIYHSREAKGYPFVTFFGTLALYLWSRYLDQRERTRWWGWVAFILAETLAIGAHYYALFLVVAQGVWLAFSLTTSWPGRGTAFRRVARWLGAQAIVGLLLLPWVLLTYQTALSGARGLEAPASPLAPGLYAWRVFRTLAAGALAPRWAAGAALGALGLAASWAVVREGRKETSLLAAVVLVPTALGFIVQRRFTFFDSRFFLYVTPALLLLTAKGIWQMRKAGMVLLVALVVAWGVALPAAFAPFQGPEEDMRPAIKSLRAAYQPGDAIVVSYIWQEGILRMEAPEITQGYVWNQWSREDVARELSGLFARHRRVWFVSYHALLYGPAYPANSWLEEHAARALTYESGFTRISLYLPPCAGDPAQIRSVLFEETIRLTYAPLAGKVRAGDTLQVPLWWMVSSVPTQRYKVFVHLTGETKKVWAQSDGEPVYYLKPFPQFPAQQYVTDCRALYIPADAPPGQYTLTVGLYHPETLKRLRLLNAPLAATDELQIGTVEVLPRAGK